MTPPYSPSAAGPAEKAVPFGSAAVSFHCMNLDSSITRRAFLEKAATITAIGFAAPHLAVAGQPAARPKPGPNSRIHVGLIGCGGMGRSNLNACAKHEDVVVTGACDPWQSRRDAVVEQFKDCLLYTSDAADE